jgi:hypothetical protein
MRLLKRYHVHDEFSGIARIHERVRERRRPSEVACSSTPWRGLRPVPVEDEIGSKFAAPSFDMELIQPMARGMMLPINSLYA